MIRYIKKVILLLRNLSDLVDRIENIEENQGIIIQELGLIDTNCDKCIGSPSCIKCSGTGIVSNSTLMGWHW